MAKFAFRLQPILGLKEKIEDLKRNEFGKAVVQLAAERQKKAEMEQLKSDTITGFRTSITQDINPNDIRQHNVFIDRLKQMIERQVQVIIRAEAYVEEKRVELIEAMREKKMLETLKEHRFEEYLEEEKRAEGKMVDELVSYKGSRPRG